MQSTLEKGTVAQALGEAAQGKGLPSADGSDGSTCIDQSDSAQGPACSEWPWTCFHLGGREASLKLSQWIYCSSLLSLSLSFFTNFIHLSILGFNNKVKKSWTELPSSCKAGQTGCLGPAATQFSIITMVFEEIIFFFPLMRPSEALASSHTATLAVVGL